MTEQVKHKSHGLMVIGAGQMRTGTYSLKLALERLYGGKCYHMIEILDKNQHHLKIWLETIDRDFLNRENCEILFNGYCSTVDNPSASFYHDLMEIYPQSKVILTTRNSDEWLRSVRNTIIRKPSYLHDLLERFSFWSVGLSELIELRSKLRCKAFHQQFKTNQYEDEFLKKCFENYNEKVRRTVPKERLLEFNVNDGWAPLCTFLNLPVPDEPFPWTNRTEDFQRIFDKIRSRVLIKYFSVVAFIGAVIVMIGVLPW